MANPSDKLDTDPFSFPTSTALGPGLTHVDSDANANRDEAATPDEVAAAIRALEATQLVKLERYAYYRMRALAGRAAGRDSGDLLREAIAVTLSGARVWRRSAVDFFGHLIGVMRSISSHWAEKAAAESAFVDEEWQMPRESAPDAVAQVAARRTLESIEARFRDDEEVTTLLRGFRDGLGGAQIREASGLSRLAYDAALKRLRRAVSAIAKESDDV